jgi:hypothetical protein
MAKRKRKPPPRTADVRHMWTGFNGLGGVIPESTIAVTPARAPRIAPQVGKSALCFVLARQQTGTLAITAGPSASSSSDRCRSLGSTTDSRVLSG